MPAETLSVLKAMEAADPTTYRTKICREILCRELLAGEQRAPEIRPPTPPPASVSAPVKQPAPKTTPGQVERTVIIL
jgi:hypothetical protein